MAKGDLTSSFLDQLNEERKKVDVASHDFSVRELVRMISDGELNAAPVYQRRFRWRAEASSLFVESVFLGLPVPPIFVATNVGFQWEVVDGLQRLSSLAHFLAKDDQEAAAVNRDAPLRLAGLGTLTELNGFTFHDLPKELQVFFGRQPLKVISLTDKSNLEVRFDVFERLNRGGIRLTPQEVRACVYRGEFNIFIDELAEDEKLTSLLKLRETNKEDGTQAEQVLKFFAYKNHQDLFSHEVEGFLNKVMVIAQTEGFNYRKEKKIFQESVDFLSRACGGSHFLRSGTNTTPLNQFEACLVAVGELIQEGATPSIPGEGWIDDSTLKDASTGGSNTRSKLVKRITRAKELFSGQS
jgi:hypothetical protein